MTENEKYIEEGESRIHHRRRSNLTPFRDEGRFRVLRFWLNLIFIVGAIAGMSLYFTSYKEVAIYILIAASIPKFIELALRIMKL